jgi:hypothetical protein
MKTETLKDWVKKWSIESIVNTIVAEGMSFMAGKITNEELKENKKVMVQEIKRRIKK